jgi:hypothetical protein
MKKYFLLFSVTLVFMLILPGCTRVGSSMNGSGKIIDNDLKVEGFSNLNIKGPFVVEVTQAEHFKVTLSTDENLMNRVNVSLERKTLNLSVKAPATFFPTSLKLKIYLPALSTLTLSDAASAAVNGFKNAETFSVFLSGKSILKCSTEVRNLELNVSGASEAILKGTGQVTEIDAREASKLDLSEFESTTGQVKMAEASEATMNVIGWIDINLRQSSKFFYLGTPIFRNTEISGGSSMAHK